MRIDLASSPNPRKGEKKRIGKVKKQNIEIEEMGRVKKSN